MKACCENCEYDGNSIVPDPCDDCDLGDNYEKPTQWEPIQKMIVINTRENLPSFYFKPTIEKVLNESPRFYTVANAGGSRKINKQHTIPYTSETWALCKEAKKLHDRWWAIQIELSHFVLKDGRSESP